VTQLLLVAALAAAIVALARRRWRRARLVRLATTRPGASPDLAIPVTSFGEIDDCLRQRRCACGGYLERRGEGSRALAGQRFRVARLECQDCERVEEVFFDTTDLLH
jgi:hypothetical protein